MHLMPSKPFPLVYRASVASCQCENQVRNQETNCVNISVYLRRRNPALKLNIALSIYFVKQEIVPEITARSLQLIVMITEHPARPLHSPTGSRLKSFM